MNPTPTSPAMDLATASSQSHLPYVIFSVGDQRFGLSTEYVREMFLIPKVTPIPNTPDYMRGLINLRGKIVSLLDLRLYIGMQCLATDTQKTIEDIKARKQDHLDWVTELENCVRENREFRLARDPSLCTFGKWFNHYHSNNATVQMELKKFATPHNAIHAAADKILKIAAQGNPEAALKMIADRRAAELALLCKLFDNLVHLLESRQREMVVVYEYEGAIMAFSVDEIIAVERIQSEQIEDNEISYKSNDIPLPGVIARREKSNEVVTLITPASFDMNQ